MSTYDSEHNITDIWLSPTPYIMIKFIEPWLINATVGQSAVRNHGAGIANGLRHELRKHFCYQAFFNALLDKRGAGVYAHFLDDLTEKVENKRARDKNNRRGAEKITWGAARKCINLVARSAVYNVYISHHYNIDPIKLCEKGYLARLELPLDSFAVAGLTNDYHKLPTADRAQVDLSLFRNFSIIGLQPDQSEGLQKVAKVIAESTIHPAVNGCRIHLDLIYWRGKRKIRR